MFENSFYGSDIINKSLQEKEKKDEMMKKVKEQIMVLKKEEDKIKKLDRDNEIYFKDIEERVKLLKLG